METSEDGGEMSHKIWSQSQGQSHTVFKTIMNTEGKQWTHVLYLIRAADLLLTDC